MNPVNNTQHPLPGSVMIAQEVPLADKNWFRTGGTARFFAAPTSAAEFSQAVAWASGHNIPLFVMGEGANILISDDGFQGLVIQPVLTGLSHTLLNAHEALVSAQAGVRMHDLIEYCLTHQLLGLEEFSGIPGTVGGSVYINLHYFEFLLAQFLVEAQVIEKKTGQIMTVDKAWFQFDYDYSTLHHHEYYLIGATFLLQRATALETAYAQGRRTEIIRHRKSRYPTARTCGSFFRNFFPSEVFLETQGKKVIWVAYYLDKVGVKGNLRHGNATVSYQHANMIVAEPGATSTDIITVARTMQTLVFEQFGIIPQPECQLIGFDQYPLLK
jgi:UDP-N-acetylmuramate dehydrogenase